MRLLASELCGSLLLSVIFMGCASDSGTGVPDLGRGGNGAGGKTTSGGGTSGALSSGGSSLGGAASGGTVTSGGANSGGAAGDTSRGGASSGGVSSGGSVAAGAATGGTSSGGLTTGGGGGGIGGGAPKGGAAGAGAPGGGAAGGTSTLEPITWPLINGVQWADTAGNPIQAHGGGIISADGYYYWFGENRNTDSTFYAVSAYRSQDLARWEFVSHVLRETSSKELDPANIERPKVIYNASTSKYVMWMHWENGVNYGEARAAVASSSSVAGPYTYHGSFRPIADGSVMDHGKPGYMSRDCTLFVDDDGKAYFISATNENYDLNLYQLTPDYLSIERLVATLFRGGHREAPALFKRNGTYFLLTSGATGWSPNQAQYATSKAIGSGWSAMTNVGDGTTFHSQSTFVLPVQGSAGTAYLYLGDRWAGAWSGRVNDSTYVWLPISFPSATTMSMSWSNTLNLDARAGTVGGATRNFRFVNVKSGKALDVEGASSANGAALIQNTEAASDSQTWSLNYNNAGYFRITNVKSKRIIDVPNESTADGIELDQWDDHNGDNQAWLIVDLGGGKFKLKNKKSSKFIAVAQASSADGAPVEQRAGGNGEEQQWKIVTSP